MFGKPKDLANELSQDGGVVANATISDAAIFGTSGHSNGADIHAAGDNKRCEVTVKVEPEGQPSFEATFKLTFTGHIPHPGQHAKVIYDPNRRSRIAIVDGTMVWGTGQIKKISLGADQLANLFGGLSAATKPDATDELTEVAGPT